MDDGKLSSLGKYETRGILGRGAMGTVYEGWDPIIARRVAIKTVGLPDLSDEQAQEELARFKREAQAAGRLSHPNIVGVFDYGETTDIAYIVMEFIDGLTLKSIIDKGERMPVAEVVRVMEELLAGLQFSHDRGVVHRDIKPANVILTRGENGQGGTVKIADFGIARIESSSMTQAGTVLGTPAYMSPEQFMGQTVDARTDIYSSGILLYQLLTGERPFEGGFSAIMHKALHTMPPRPSELSVTAPAGMDAVVARAIAKRPDERYGSALEFARALRTAIEAPPPPVVPQTEEETLYLPGRDVNRTTVRPQGTTPVKPAEKPASRLPLFVAVGVAAVVAVGGGTWFALRPNEVPVIHTGPSEHAPFPSNTNPTGPDTRTAGIPNTGNTGTPTGTPVTPTVPVVPPIPVTPAIPDATPARPPNPATGSQQGSATPSKPAGDNPPVVPPIALADPAQVAPVVPPVPVRPPVSKTAVASALAAIPCSLIGGDVVQPGDTVVLTGLVANSTASAARRAMAEVAPGAPVEWHVTSFDGPYCRVLDLLRAQGPRFATSSNGFTLSLAGDHDRVLLHDGELITLRMTMPDFPTQLTADYFQHDGTVFHMHPTTTDGPRLYPAGSRQTLGDPTTGGARWEVGEPYGTDLIVTIASSVPLLSTRRSQSEDSEAYLRDLQTAIETAKKRNAKIAVGATILETAAKAP